MNNPKYFNKKKHLDNLISNPYYHNLIKLRNTIEIACDIFFQKLGAPKIDLFLITKSVSSPIGKGSDSKPISLKYNDRSLYLVDSAQFGMEPLVFTAFEMVYCYLPSFRGEDPDHRHLNQFYHCEAEMRGEFKKCMIMVENLVKHLVSVVIDEHKKGTYKFEKDNFEIISTLRTIKFPVVTFDEVDEILTKHGFSHLIKRYSFGRILTNQGELKIGELIGKNKLPVWVTMFDRDVVAFYQKPNPDNLNKVLNGDLIFPSIKNSLGGEIVGCGQRQDNIEELEESMRRQKIKNIESYKWYLDLRKNPSYQTTSGFGLGVERFIAWILGLDSIYDAAVYPVIKNEMVL